MNLSPLTLHSLWFIFVYRLGEEGYHRYDGDVRLWDFIGMLAYQENHGTLHQ